MSWQKKNEMNYKLYLTTLLLNKNADPYRTTSCTNDFVCTSTVRLRFIKLYHDNNRNFKEK